MPRLRSSLWMPIMILMVCTGPAWAIDGWGPRFGFTAGPDQLHFGAHLKVGEIAPRLVFQPNFELGAGDRRTVAAFNMEAVYYFTPFESNWRPYLGGGPGMNLIDRDYVGRNDDTELEAGWSVVGGLEHPMASGNSFFTELKLGLLNEPDVKWTMGFTFPQ